MNSTPNKTMAADRHAAAQQFLDRHLSRHGVRPAITGLGAMGSHLTRGVAQHGKVTHLDLIDSDEYAEHNRVAQQMDSRDVGRNKAAAQASALRRMGIDATIRAWRCAVEEVPRGCLLGSILMGCVDSRAARQTLNEICWQLGIPWIDAGVDAAHQMARVTVYLPLPDAACLECGWHEADYQALSQSYSCGATGLLVPPTAAQRSLGMLAAAMAADALERLIGGDAEQLGVGRQWLIDIRHRQGNQTRYVRNRACRFNHQAWTVQPLALHLATTRLDQLHQRLADQYVPSSVSDAWSWHVPGRQFVRRLRCGQCGRVSQGRLLIRGLRGSSGQRCRRCRAELQIESFHSLPALSPQVTKGRWRRRTLASLGLRDGDILAVTCHRQVRHLVITGETVPDGTEHGGS